MPEATDIQDVLAESISRLRRENGMDQELLAIEMRGCGVDWSRATVAQIETKRRRVVAGELVALAAVFDVGLADLFKTDAAWVNVGTGRCSGAYLAQRCRGEVDPDLPGDEGLEDHEWAEGLSLRVMAFALNVEKFQKERDQKWGLGSPKESVLERRQRRHEAIGGPEAATALRLRLKRGGSREIDGWAVIAASLNLWGHDLMTEHAQRVAAGGGAELSPASLRAHRGRVTRQLDAELLAEISRMIDEREPGSRSTEEQT